MAGVIIADLPDISEVSPDNYVIVEKPNLGAGTYKATVGDLQKATTVTTEIITEETSDHEIIYITITDINGAHVGTIFVPIAWVEQLPGDLTRYHLHISSASGGSDAYITVPAARVYQTNNITHVEITDEHGTTDASIVAPLADVSQEGQVTHIHVVDSRGSSDAYITTPTAKIVDNGNNTSTITITDGSGVTSETIVSRVELDFEPTEGSDNLVNSGSLFTEFNKLKQIIAKQQQLLDKLEEAFVWEGTRAEWDALSEEEKIQYKIINLTDDPNFVLNR